MERVREHAQRKCQHSGIKDGVVRSEERLHRNVAVCPRIEKEASRDPDAADADGIVKRDASWSGMLLHEQLHHVETGVTRGQRERLQVASRIAP
jgi:hypothetical protein